LVSSIIGTTSGEGRRCAECHSVSRNGLRRWRDYTEDAWQTCGLDRDPAEILAGVGSGLYA
jgi:hypothetical protein